MARTGHPIHRTSGRLTAFGGPPRGATEAIPGRPSRDGLRRAVASRLNAPWAHWQGGSVSGCGSAPNSHGRPFLGSVRPPGRGVRKTPAPLPFPTGRTGNGPLQCVKRLQQVDRLDVLILIAWRQPLRIGLPSMHNPWRQNLISLTFLLQNRCRQIAQELAPLNSRNSSDIDE